MAQETKAVLKLLAKRHAQFLIATNAVPASMSEVDAEAQYLLELAYMDGTDLDLRALVGFEMLKVLDVCV